MPNLIFDYLKPESDGRLASKIHCNKAPFLVKPVHGTFSIFLRAAQQVLQHRRVQAAAHHQDFHRRLVGLHLLYFTVCPHCTNYCRL